MALTLKQALAMFWEQIQVRFVKREDGKGLSTNDFTTEEKNKLASLDNITVDTTLTIEGATADAKATGEAIGAVSALVGDAPVATQITNAISAIPQADLAQNDPSAPDYVKNRTHWEEGVILPETELAVFEIEGATQYPILLSPLAQVEVGKKYVVVYNNTAYDIEAKFDEGDGVYSLAHDFGGVALFPEAIEYPSVGMIYGLVFAMDGSTPITLSIVEKDAPIHKLDPKFLPDTVVMAEPPVMQEVILPETEMTYSNEVGGYFARSQSLPEEGKKYVVTYNGTAYDCACWMWEVDPGDFAPAFGNSSLVGVEGGNSDAPFLIMLGEDEAGVLQCVFMLTDDTTPASVILSIVQTEEVIPQQLIMDIDGNIKWEDRTHWIEGGTIDILPEATYTDDASIEAGMATPLSHALVAGEVYQVNYNGTIYKCTCIGVTESGITIPVLGNTEMMNIPGGNPDAPFVFMEIPRGIPDAPENMYWQLLPTDESGEALPLTFGIKYEGEIIHKIDNKFLDIAPSNWNALPGTTGYIENRTHYCDHIVMTYDPAKLAGVDTLAVDFSGNPITFYKIGDYALDAAALKASSYTITTLSTGEQSTTTVTMAQDNNGISTGMAPAFFIYSIHDLAAASESGIVAPSTGTYIVVLLEEACAVTIDAGEILKKLDEKYLPDNTINTVNSVNGQTGDVVLTAADVGAVANTLNIENGEGYRSLSGKGAYATSDYSLAVGSQYQIGNITLIGDAGAVVYRPSMYNYDLSPFKGCYISYSGKSAKILKVELNDDKVYEYTLSNTLSDTAINRERVTLYGITEASGVGAMALGHGVIANGSCSNATGEMTVVNGSHGTAIGICNKDDDPTGYYIVEDTFYNNANLSQEYNICDREPSVNLDTGEINLGEKISKLGSELAIGDYFYGIHEGYLDNGKPCRYYSQIIEEEATESSSTKRLKFRQICIVNYAGNRGTYAVMLGNGKISAREGLRSNAHAIDWDGNAYFAGDVYVQGDGTTFEFDGKKKLATESYVDSKIPTPEDALALMIEMGFVDPVADETGAMYTDDNGKIFTY